MNPPIFNRKTSFVEFLGILCIFSVFLDKAIRGVFAFDFYYYYPIFLLFLAGMVFQKGTIVLPPRWFWLGCMIVFSTSILVLTINNMLGFEFWKQVFGIVFTAVVYYNVLYYFNFNIRLVFSHYLQFAYWVALFGVFDNFLHIVGIHITKVLPLGSFLFREFSIMGEPFYLALALTPAVAYYIARFRHSWQHEKRRFIIVMTCYLVTYSSIAVAGVVLSVLFSLYLNGFFSIRKNRLIIAPFIIIPVFFLINLLVENVHLINVRMVHTTQLFFSNEFDVRSAGMSNSSTFALFSNYIIARDSFLNDPLFGSGLGSHPLIYTETFLKYFPSEYLHMFGAQNQQDANSKFLRLMGETGIVGLVLFFMAYIRFFARRSNVSNQETHELTAINYSIFIYILLCLIRNGNYINIGFFLLFFMYYVSYRLINAHSKHVARYQPTVAA